MDLSAIHPVNFYNDQALRTESIGSPETSCIIHQIQHINTIENSFSYTDELFFQDFIINNITQLSNTFMIKLLEDNINKDEIAYIVDFNAEFDMKNYIRDTLKDLTVTTHDDDRIINIIRSNIVFILNQFIQFYCMYKLIYNEGVELYEFLYKETYGESAPKNVKSQNKYVFCYSIMNNILESILPDIDNCCNELKSTISNIKLLFKGGYNNG